MTAPVRVPSRHPWLRGAVAAALLLLVIGLVVARRASLPTAAPRGSAAPPPNIVLIITDDQRWDTLQYMPNVTRRLVGAGVNFTNSFVTTAICCPSRTSTLTGEYAHNTGIRFNEPPHGGAPDFDASSTVATWLHDKGYATGLFGKYLNSYASVSPAVPPGWDSWYAFVEDTSDYNEFDVNDNGMAEFRRQYSTDWARDRTIDFIRAHAKQPFFAYFAPFAPHHPAQAAPRHADAFGDLAPWRPRSYQEADLSDKTPWWQRQPTTWEETTEGGTPATMKVLDAFRIKQLRTLLAVDEAVGAIMDTLEQNGIARDTLVIFTSDNGFAWGEHWWRNKLCAYEECIRVPLVAYYPRLVPQARTEQRLVLNIDLAPTFAELAGIPIPASVDGRSFAGILRGAEADWRTAFLIEHVARKETGLPTFNAVRTDRWKYILSVDSEFEELYDLDADPDEMDNVVVTKPGDPAQVNVLAGLRTRLRALVAE